MGVSLSRRLMFVVATTTLVMGAAALQASAYADTDVSPPTVVSFGYTPKAVNLYTGSKTVTASIHLTDTGGVKQADLMVDSDTTTQRYLATMTRVSGTATDGIWQASVTLSPASATGPWTVSSYAIEDTVGNVTSVTHPTKLDVSNSPSTVPEPVTSVTAVPDHSAAQVSWTPSVSGNGEPISGYTVTASPGGSTCVTSATQCTVSGLTSGTEYTFTVVASNVNGDSPPSPTSNPVTPDAVPNAPPYVSVYPGNQQVRVTWGAADGNGSPILEYHVRSNPGGFDCQDYLDPTRYSSPPHVTGTSCYVTGLTNGVDYTFTVTADNKFGASAPSTSATVHTATLPGPPTQIQASPRDQAAVVSWQPPTNDGGDPIQEYRVLDEAGNTVCSTTELSCEVTGLTNGQIYRYNVIARNRVGTSSLPYYPAAATVPYGTPLPPTQVTTTPTQDGVQVAWTDADPNGSPVTGYQVRADGTDIGCSSTSTSSCLVTGLNSGTAYTFSVSAKNAAGWGTWSQPSAPSTWTYTPHADADLAVTPASSTASWRNGTATADFTVTLTNSGPDPITDATVTLDILAGDTIVSQTGLLDCSTSPCEYHGSLLPGQQITAALRLRLGGAGTHTVTASGQVTPSSSTPIATASGKVTLAADTTAPRVALGSTPRFTTASVVRIPWSVTESGSGVNQFVVQTRRTAFGGRWTSWKSQQWSPSAREMRLSPAAGNDYCYRIKAEDEAGNWSTGSSKCTARFLDDQAFLVSSQWTDAWSTAYWNNTAVTSKARGATAMVSNVSGNRVALLATRCSGCGTVDVLVGGKMVGHANLYASRTLNRQVITLPKFAARTGSLVIRVTSQGKRVTLDGVAVGRG